LDSINFKLSPYHEKIVSKKYSLFEMIKEITSNQELDFALE